MRWTLQRFEEELLRSVLAALRDVLDDGGPDDVVLRRLLPAAVPDDPALDAEVRELIHDEVAGIKRAGVMALIELLDSGTPRGSTLRVQLDDEAQLLVLGVLNDIRLAIGAQVGIDELDRAAVEDGTALGYRLAVMDHLGGWQELLLEQLTDDAAGSP